MALELTVSWSEIDAWRQCPKKHQVFYLDRWKEPLSGPLRKGIAWHELMERWYRLLQAGKAGDGIDQYLEWANKRMADDPDGDLLLWMLEGYIRHWGGDLDWTILGIELGDVVPFPRPRDSEPLVSWDGTEVAVYLKLKVDLLVETLGFNRARRLWVVDHKSGGSLPGDRALEFEDQFGLYIWAMRAVGRPVYGAIHNAALAKMNKTEAAKPKALADRFKREETVRVDAELDEIARDAYETIRSAWQPYLLQGSGWRAPRIPNGDTCRYRCSLTETCLNGRQQGWAVEQRVMAMQGMEQIDYTNLRELEVGNAESVEGTGPDGD